MKQTFKTLWKSLVEIHGLLKGILSLSVLSGILEGLLPFVLIYISGWVVSRLEVGVSEKQLYKGIVVALSAFLVLHILTRFLELKRQRYKTKLSYNKDMKISEKMMAMDYIDIENPELHLKKRQIENNDNIGGNIEFVAESIHVLMVDFITVLVGFWMVFGLGGSGLSLWMVIGFALAVFFFISIGLWQQKKVHQYFFEAYGEVIEGNRLFGFYFEYVAHYKTGKMIRLYNKAPMIQKVIHGFICQTGELLERIQKKSAKNVAMSGMMMAMASLSIYLFVGIQAVRGKMDAGEVVRSIAAITLLVKACASIMKNGTTLLNWMSYLELYFDFMETPESLYHGKIPTEKRDDDAYEIEFKDVWFKYPGAETYALKGVSLKLKIGEKLAIVGMNGSGKTTLVKLLCRLYEPSQGTILLNGIDIKKYSIDDYQALFAIVFQDFNLMAFSLAENVATHKSYHYNKVRDALAQVGFSKRLETLDKGVKTSLYRLFDSDGIEVSGGEAQKIALARAIYQNAPIIVLDEPTAALDPLAEFEIYTHFNDIVKEKTTFYISHRLSSCRFCDEVVVFHEGELVERGRHEMLLKVKDSKYAELWEAQACYYKDSVTKKESA